MRKLTVLAGLLPAAALAVTLVWMGGDEARADSFNPIITVSVANTVADTPSDVAFHLEFPEGDVWSSTVIRFFPTDWQVTASSDVDIAVPRSAQDWTFQPGLLNSPCNNPLPLDFDMLNATIEKSQTVTFEDASDDSNGDGNPDLIDMYPEFNDRVLGPAPPVLREAGVANVSGVAILNQSLFYEPGATIAGQALDPALGAPFVTLLENMGDPEAVPMPSSVTDMCSPFSGTAVVLGSAEDGTVLLKNPKQAGTYTFYLLAVGLRDADGDGHENNLDPCPLTADPDWDPRATAAVGPGDADGDGLPSSCDPDDNDPNTDEDGDGFLNRQDNCPLVANGVADADNQGDSDFDGIGDACDPNPDNADSEGEVPEVLLSQDVTITEAAAPPATPLPAESPTPTPPVDTVTPTVIAPPAGGAGSASGTSWPWWPLAVAGAAAAAAGAMVLAYRARRAKP